MISTLEIAHSVFFLVISDVEIAHSVTKPPVSRLEIGFQPGEKTISAFEMAFWVKENAKTEENPALLYRIHPRRFWNPHFCAHD